MTILLNKSRLKFLCRRGMKELDEIFIPFFDENFDALDPLLQQDFAQLLACEETDLFDYFILGKPCPENLEKIVARIGSKNIDKPVRMTHGANAQ